MFYGCTLLRNPCTFSQYQLYAIQLATRFLRSISNNTRRIFILQYRKVPEIGAAISAESRVFVGHLAPRKVDHPNGFFSIILERRLVGLSVRI